MCVALPVGRLCGQEKRREGEEKISEVEEKIRGCPFAYLTAGCDQALMQAESLHFLPPETKL